MRCLVYDLEVKRVLTKSVAMATASLIIAIIAFTLGIGFIYWINRRKFYRRNMAGLEGFSSFEKSVAVSLFERIVKLIGYLLIIAGFIFLWLAYIADTDQERRQKKIEMVQPIRR